MTIKSTLFALGMSVAFLGSAGSAVAGAVEVAAMPVMQVGRAQLPSVLSQSDVERYQRIFALQTKGAWITADKEISKLSDRVLMGHVMAQRYLHPTKYRSKYKELKGWLASYADHHYAPQLYKLALRRRPANWKYPARPETGRALYKAPTVSFVQAKPAKRKLSRSHRRQIYRYKITIKT
ncbi:MAG: hypothetical protein KAI28_11920, partial [Sphingomonadales bacterium]|nr:hypothetical protein [Sphingomonadales bacterium]